MLWGESFGDSEKRLRFLPPRVRRAMSKTNTGNKRKSTDTVKERWERQVRLFFGGNLENGGKIGCESLVARDITRAEGEKK